MTEDNKKIPQGQHINDDEQWGNIQLPGITDEQLHDRKYQRKLRMQQVTSSPKWLAATTEANQLNAQTESWNAACAKVWEDRKNNPEEYEKWLIASTEGVRRVANDPERVEKISKGQKASWQTEERQELGSRLSKERWQDEQYRESVIADQRHAVVTPDGEFESLSAYSLATGRSFTDLNRIMPHLYYKKATGPGEPTYQKYWNTPHGKFHSKQAAFLHAYEIGDPLVFSRIGSGKMSGATAWWNACVRQFPDTCFVSEEQRTERKVNTVGGAKGNPVHTPNGVFDSVMAVARAAGVPPSRVKAWMRDYPNDYYFVNRKKDCI